MLARIRMLLLAMLAIGAVTGLPAGNIPAQAKVLTETCRPITPQQVAVLFDRWNASLAKTPDAVILNYSTDAVLLPTKENGPLIGRQEIRGYFVHFLAQHPTGVIDQRTIKIGCNMAFDVGLYTFTVDGSQPGSRTKIAARYTFIYEPRGTQWLIVHHHSSVLPEPPKVTSARETAE